MNQNYHLILLFAWIGIGLVLFPFLLRITAPYGRHLHGKWGPLIPNRLGWMIMEVWALVGVSYWFWTGITPKSQGAYFIYGLYFVHYTYRSLVFPFLTHTSGKKMPLLIAVAALFFNTANTFFIGSALGNAGGQVPKMGSPLLWIGLAIFISGAFIHLRSDAILIGLRKPGEKGYFIPRGFLFRFVSCPNLFGEMVEWAGFALMIGSFIPGNAGEWFVFLSGWSFALWTGVNLIPRALQHHAWYLKTFPDYPKERKAFIPFIW
ncbi:MAG: DUF1295 domain-containing protein [Spirochaetia bacterium]|nr:DUF1295 domain-containing protein [Spirochaetia bacterium]